MLSHLRSHCHFSVYSLMVLPGAEEMVQWVTMFATVQTQGHGFKSSEPHQVWPSSTHVDNNGTPMGRWEVEAGESPEV